MNLSKVLFGAFAATVAFAAPASADYTILHDVAYPSVVYIEFDGSAQPTVIEAPTANILSTDPALPAVSSGEGQSGAAPAKEEQAQQDDRTVEERVMDKVAEIDAMTPEELETTLEDNLIENEILDDAELR